MFDTIYTVNAVFLACVSSSNNLLLIDNEFSFQNVLVQCDILIQEDFLFQRRLSEIQGGAGEIKIFGSTRESSFNSYIYQQVTCSKILL